MLLFDRLVLEVADLDRSLRFYTQVLDFQVAGNTDWAGHRTAILQLGMFHILLLEQPQQDSQARSRYQIPKSGPVIGLADQRIEARADELQRNGIELVAPLRPSPWGGRSLMLRDPDGYLIMIQEPGLEPDDIIGSAGMASS